MKITSQAYVPVNEGAIQGSIIALTILTAIVHLLLAFSHGLPMGRFPVLFLLNGVGYLVLLATLYWRPFAAIQRPIRWLLIAYTALTIILWAYFTHAAFDPFEYTDKLAEIFLLVLLFIEAILAKNVPNPFVTRSTHAL